MIELVNYLLEETKLNQDFETFKEIVDGKIKAK